MNDRLSPFESFFQDAGQVAMDRTFAELRAGRPIAIEASDGLTVVAALDAVSPSLLDTFTRPDDGNRYLVLSQVRAKVLGLPASGPVAICIAGLYKDAVYRLAIGVDALAPEGWVPADGPAGFGIELCKYSFLLPAALVSRQSSHHELPAAIHRIKFEQAELLLKHKRYELEIISRAQVSLAGADEASFVVFRGGPVLRDQVAIILGDPNPKRPVLVRMHSACLTGDLFGALRCDCGDQLRNTLPHLATEHGGVLLYLDQEGRGIGIRNKMRAYALQDEGLDTIDADATLGYASDERHYEIAASMLRVLGYPRIRLLTNNPDKVQGLQRAGIDVVGRQGLMGTITAENQGYLSTKEHRAGHLLNGSVRPIHSVESA